MLKKKIKAYLSGPIRGFMGKAATEEIIQMNIAKGIEWGKVLWTYFGSNLDLYVPHVHDVFPQTAMEKGYLNINQTLDVDCEIVSQCDVLLIANWENHISGGMNREIDTAFIHHIPCRVFTGVDEDELKVLGMWLERI